MAILAYLDWIQTRYAPATLLAESISYHPQACKAGPIPLAFSAFYGVKGSRRMNITVVGTGYVGLVTGACFSDWGHHVLCVDNDEGKIDQLKQLRMPIYEEGLEELVKRNVAAGRLRFTTSIAEGTHFAEVIFVAVGTPPGYRGAANLSYVEQVGRLVAEHMNDYSCS
jgi:Predicted UDP-glucose 6-dehydrogenase